MDSNNYESEGKLVDYFLALQRIQNNKPERVAASAQITLRLVSLEAGRKGDSIKRSRPQFRHLVDAIDKAAESQAMPRRANTNKIDELRYQLQVMTADRDAAVGREISLLYEVYHLKKHVKELTGKNILPLRPSKTRDTARSDE